jgi:hypothetical protein
MASTVTAGTASTATVSGTAGVAGGILTKATLVALVVGGLTGGGYLLTRERKPSPQASATAPTAAGVNGELRVMLPAKSEEKRAVTEPVAATTLSLSPAAPPKPEPRRMKSPKATVTEQATPHAAEAEPATETPASTAVEQPPPTESQSATLSRAWTLLDTGNSQEALAIVVADAAAHPNGALEEERAALQVRALVSLDRRPEARKAASAFLARYPVSIHRAAIEAALDP